MKVYLVEHFVSTFREKWPLDFYLADFILSHIISHPHFYYNFNKPDYFSINGKNGLCVPLVDFIDSVANIQPTNTKFKEEYTAIVIDLIRRGAPSSLFKDLYQNLVL